MAHVKGPGLLYVNSKITSPLLSEETYVKWYSEDHIAEIIQTSGVTSAIRFKDIDPAADKPNLVLYPMENIGFTQGEEFKKIKVHSEILPNKGPIYDYIEIDVRYYRLEQVFDPKGTKPRQTKLAFTAGMELGPQVTEQDFNDWYTKEHLNELAKTPSYLRTTRFKLLYSRTNAESRILKGLPPRPEDKDIKAPPTFLAIHEFDTETPDLGPIMKTAETEWSKRIIKDVERIESPMFRVVERYGDGKFFSRVMG